MQRLQSGTASRTSAIFNGVLVVLLVLSIAVVILFLAILVQLWKQQILLLPGRKWTAGWLDSAPGWWSFHRLSFGTSLWKSVAIPNVYHHYVLDFLTFNDLEGAPCSKKTHVLQPMHHPSSQAGNAPISPSEMFDMSPTKQVTLTTPYKYDLFIYLLYQHVSTYPWPPHFTSCCCLHCFNVHLPKGLRLGDGLMVL